MTGSAALYQHDEPDCSYSWFVNNQVTESMTYNVNEQLTSKGFNSSSEQLLFDYEPEITGFSITTRRPIITGRFIRRGTRCQRKRSAIRFTEAADGGEFDADHGEQPAAWTQTYGYDGFGNMTSKVLNGGTNSIPWTVDGTTNRFNSGAELRSEREFADGTWSYADVR